MKLYFDTNVYDFVCKCNEADVVSAWLRTEGHRVMASGSNLIEMWAIADDEIRTDQVRTLTGVATEFESLPDSYRQAQEVLSEVQRTHPRWVRSPSASERKAIRAFLKANRDHWKSAKEYPGEAPGFFAYSRHAATADKKGQKKLRDALRQFGGIDHPGLKVTSSAKPGLSLPNEELFWRSDGLTHWSAALFRRQPSVRDYFDWLAPHLSIQSISMKEFVSFWIEEVDASQLPRTRIIGLTAYFQLRSRVTPGNPQDINHSSHLLGCDLVLTADRPFYRVLSDVRTRMDGGGFPVLVNKGMESAQEAIRSALSDRSSM